MTRMQRREVLKAAAAAAVAPIVLPSRLLGAAAPSEQLKIAVIGLGGRARGVIGDGLRCPDYRLAAVCDIFKPRVDSYVAQFNKDHADAPIKGYTRISEMLDREKLDGVMVQTTTHARAWCVIQCLKRGINTYIEKPMCLTIEEGRAMVDAARKHKCVTQVGTQQRSIPLNNWACDLIQGGAIGKVRVVEAPNFIGPMEWDNKPAQKMPDGGSDDWWDVWTNAAQLRPYHQELHYGWARWSDYDAGGLCFGVSGWGTHSYDQVQRGLGTSDTAPTAILLEEKMETRDSGRFGQRQIGDDETGAPYYGMAKLSGPRARITMRYANGAELRLHLDGDRGPGLGCIFVGTGGKIEVNRDKISANPKELLARDDRPKTLDELGFSETQLHIQNWLDCIKSREKANADVEYGHYSTMICNLVNAVRETGLVGKTLQWDPKAERFTNCDEANENRWIKRPRRKGYELDV